MLKTRSIVSSRPYDTHTYPAGVRTPRASHERHTLTHLRTAD